MVRRADIHRQTKAGDICDIQLITSGRSIERILCQLMRGIKNRCVLFKATFIELTNVRVSMILKAPLRKLSHRF